jgi:hypothetical protein
MSAADNDAERAVEGTHTAAAGDQVRLAGAGSREVGAVPGSVEVDDRRLDELLPLGFSPLAPRVRGRPQGAKNRRTDLVAQYLVDRFGDPLTASMATAGMPLRELITELRSIASDVGMKLGASVMDIARFQRECRNDALPYIHAKRAPETAKGDPVVPIIGIGRFEQHNTVVQVGGRSIEDALDQAAKNMQPDQSVKTIDGEVSHEGKSHDES